MSRPPSPTSVEQRIRAKLRRARGSETLTLVAATDFLTIGSRRAVDTALHRLAEQKVLQRLTRGLYFVPRVHPLLGSLHPTPDAVVAAMVTKHRIRVQPSGAHAANLLGLSDQVPMRLVYLTDGPARQINVGKLQIVLKRTTPKNMATAGRLSGLIIQALRYLGKRYVDQAMVATLRRRIAPVGRAQLLKDAPLAPTWIGQVMRELAEGSAT